MRNSSTGMMWRFFFLYVGVMLFAVSVLTVDNIVVNGQPLNKLALYNLKVVFLQGATGVSLFQAITFIRLRPALQYLSRGGEEAPVAFVWRRLIRFPDEMFWGMVIFGILMSILYHFIFPDPTIISAPWEVGVALMSEQTLSLIMAILFYTVIRLLLRPYILNLPSAGMKELPPASFIKPLTISFFSLILIAVLRPVFYVLRVTVGSPREPLDIWVMFALAGSALIFGLFLFLLLAWQLRTEIQELIRGLFSLLQGDRAWLYDRMPIMSQDEVGQLGLAFNRLQEHISREYREVEQEMQLAYQVQQRLLPPAAHLIGGCRITAVCLPVREVGGDLYDIVRLSEDRFAVLAGDVSGHGMPSALVMSAILVLFRAEVRRGGSAGELLNRLNQSMVDTLQGNMFVTLGLGIFDLRKGTLEYASAGHMAPYLLRGGQVTQIPCSSLPLGISKAETYRQVVIPILAADRFVLYTDGVVEAMDENGKMFGFPEFEHYLSLLNQAESARGQLDALVKNLPRNRGSHDDDLTIILVECPQNGTIFDDINNAV